MSGERLRRSAGSREDLARLLGNEMFGPLVTAIAARLGETRRLEHTARQTVTVEGPDGNAATYVFALALSQSGESGGCWLISGLERDWLPG